MYKALPSSHHVQLASVQMHFGTGASSSRGAILSPAVAFVTHANFGNLLSIAARMEYSVQVVQDTGGVWLRTGGHLPLHSLLGVAKVVAATVKATDLVEEGLTG